VLFEPLSQNNIRKIVDIQFRHIQRMLLEQGITLDATDEALTKLGAEGFDPAFGARPLKRVLQRRILNELSKGILSGHIAKDAVIMMELNGNGEIVFENVGGGVEI
jgi:ATP-dependent Clp protease ATP-binding subunit ClpB